MGLVARNVVPLVEAAKKPGPRMDDVLTVNEATALLRAARGHRLEAMVTVALTVGLDRALTGIAGPA